MNVSVNQTDLPDPSQVLVAAARIAAHAHITPLLHSHTLDTLSGARLFFKMESLQRGGAFKFRGACNAVHALSKEQAARGVITHSSGNHGAALALAAQLRSIPCHVVIPEGAIASKIENIRRYGAQIWRCGPSLVAREAECSRVQQHTGATLIHPYTHPQVIAGQGTVALELVQQAKTPLDAIVVPVGGGGLAAGTWLALQQAAPDCELILAEPSGADDTARSLALGKLVSNTAPDTICDGLRTNLGAPNFALLKGHASVIVVDDAATIAAQRWLLQVLKQVVEPSSSIGLAAILAQPQRFAGRSVGVVLSGGNVDSDALPWHQP